MLYIPHCSIRVSKEKETNGTCHSVQNFGLTELSFESYVQELRKGNEALIECIYHNFFKECRQTLINYYGIHDDTAYDIVIETLISFRNKLILGKIKWGNLRYTHNKENIH